MPQVPKTAPTQTVVTTGKGPTPKGKAGQPAQPALAAPPASAATTGPKIAEPSVDYNTQQGNRIPADVLHHPTAVTPLGQQDQRT
jgi:hypothetical protein